MATKRKKPSKSVVSRAVSQSSGSAPSRSTDPGCTPAGLPAGFEILWTGMRVVKHDGSRHHTIGVIPTIPVEPTLAGVIAGRDEVLEAALDALTK